MNKEQFQRLVELLQCPINQDGYLMSEPHIASDGNTYEREAIAEWFKRSTTSPMTREPLDPTVTRNRFMERVIELVREVDPTLKLSPSSSMSAFARAVRLGESLDRFELSPLEFIVFVDELSQDAEIAALSHLTSFEEQGNHILYTIAQSARLTKEYFRIGGSPMVHGRAVGTATLPPEQFLTYEYFMQLRDVNVEGLSPRVRANYLCATQPETEEDLRAADLDARLAAAAAHAGPLFSDDELSEHKHALQRVGYLARHYAQRIRNGLIEIDVLTIAPELMVWPITACPIPKFGRGSHANHCEPLAFAFLSARRTAFVPDSGTVKLLSSQSTTLAHHAHALGLPAMAWAVASHPDFPRWLGRSRVILTSPSTPASRTSLRY